MEDQSLNDPLRPSGGAIVTGVGSATRRWPATWLRALEVLCLDTGDAHLLTGSALQRPVAVMHGQDGACEGGGGGSCEKDHPMVSGCRAVTAISRKLACHVTITLPSASDTTRSWLLCCNHSLLDLIDVLIRGRRMSADTSVKLKLSVWREFSPSRALVQWRAESSAVHVLSGDRHLQQEIYSWQMKEDPFGGVADNATRANLHELLMERFTSSKSPDERRIELLNDFIEEARRVVDGGQSEWTGSQAAPNDDEDAPYMMNPLLALSIHLDWLRSSFAGQPGISVSIR